MAPCLSLQEVRHVIGQLLHEELQTNTLARSALRRLDSTAANRLTLDPATGTVTSAKPSAGRLALSLAPRQAIILVQLVNR